MNENSLFRRREAVFYDIVALLDNSGAVVVKYKYDAWGNCQTTVVNSDASTIANLNPFRYRSYYFDTEIGFYFLKTRYYDPEIGRFMTIDDISYLNPESTNGLNQYAYCLNNPIMHYDPSGHLPFFVITAIIGVVIGFGIAAQLDYTDDGKVFNGSISVWQYLGCSLIVGGIGALVGLTTAAFFAGKLLATANQVFIGLKGLIWAIRLGGPGAAGLYLLNNFFYSIKVNSSWLGYYPPNNGFVTTNNEILDVGTKIQRYGDTLGRFVTNVGASKFELSLPYDKLAQSATIYVVNIPIEVIGGKIAPWFNQVGGGYQYLLPKTIKALLDSGIISIL